MFLGAINSRGRIGVEIDGVKKFTLYAQHSTPEDCVGCRDEVRPDTILGIVEWGSP